MQTVDLFSSIECPFAYLGVYRLRKVLPEFAGRVEIHWRALSLEYINHAMLAKPVTEAELGLLLDYEPDLPVRGWLRQDWEWPSTMWPAFEALACAQAQGSETAAAMSWALRYAFFAEGRCLAHRHELLAVAMNVSQQSPLDLARFEKDWDTGRYKDTVIADSRLGWHELKVNGSPTYVLPDGSQYPYAGLGNFEFDEATLSLVSYTPPALPPLDDIRAVLGKVGD